MYAFCGANDSTNQIVLEKTHKIWTGENAYDWEIFPLSGGFEPRNFSTATQILIDDKPKVLIFGGKTNGYLADTYIFDPISAQTEALETTGKGPSPRYGMTSVTYNNNVYVMGGYDNNGFLCNDIFVLNIERKEWREMEVIGTPLPARMHHTAVCFDNLMVVYGGKGEKSVILDDLFVINLDSGLSTSRMPEKSEQWPGPRKHHACVALNKDEMILIGGRTKIDTLSNDVFIFSLSTSRWQKIGVTGEFPGREFHTAVFTGSEIWVYGGKGENNKPLLCTKLLPDFIAMRFYDLLPRDLTLLVLSFLSITELARFGQTCHTAHKFAEENILWIQLCKSMDPTYKYMPLNTNNDDKNSKISPKNYLKDFGSIWMNSFEIPPDPIPANTIIP